MLGNDCMGRFQEGTVPVVNSANKDARDAMYMMSRWKLYLMQDQAVNSMDSSFSPMRKSSLTSVYTYKISKTH